MASFLPRLDDLLAAARGRNILSEAAAEDLRQLAVEREKPRRHGVLVAAVCLIGAIGAALGLILLLEANWREIPDAVKLLGFLVLFGGSHGGGLWLRWKRPEYANTAEALNFVGAGLFIGGLALVNRIFHISGNSSNGALLWFVVTAALTVALRSTPLAGMTLAAGIVWGFMRCDLLNHEQSFMVFSATLPFLLLGLAPAADQLKESMGSLLRYAGAAILGGILYIIGFFRFWRPVYYRSAPAVGLEYWMYFGLLAVLAGAAAAVWGVPVAVRSRGRGCLFFLLVATALAFFAAIGMYAGMIDAGASTSTTEFGSRLAACRGPWLVSLGAWALWFVWALWLVFEGCRRGRDGWAAIGVYAAVIGLLTRYFDLIGALAWTGPALLIGGVLLLLAGWSAEKWRRKLRAGK